MRFKSITCKPNWFWTWTRLCCLISRLFRLTEYHSLEKIHFSFIFILLLVSRTVKTSIVQIFFFLFIFRVMSVSWSSILTYKPRWYEVVYKSLWFSALSTFLVIHCLKTYVFLSRLVQVRVIIWISNQIWRNLWFRQTSFAEVDCWKVWVDQLLKQSILNKRTIFRCYYLQLLLRRHRAEWSSLFSLVHNCH